MPKTNNKEKQFKKWRGRVNWAISSSKSRQRRWKAAQKLYEANMEGYEFTDNKEGMPKVPLLFSVFATMLPSLFTTMPKVKATPKRPEDAGKSKLVDSVLKDIFHRTRIYNEIKEVVLAAVVKGTGYVKIGFKAETEKKPRAEEEILESFRESFPAENIESETFDEFMKDQANLFDEIITEEGVWVKYVPNKFLYLDPEARDFESCNFIVHKILMSVEDFKEKYKGIELKKESLDTVESNGLDDEANRNSSMSEFHKSMDSKRVKVYEIWSKKDQKYIVYADGHDKLLENKEWIYKNLESYPFDVLTLSPMIDSIYGVELLLMLEDAERINTEMIDSQEDNAQRSSSGQLYEDGAIDEDQLDELEKPGSGKLSKVKDISRIRDYSVPPISPETYNVSNTMRALVEEVAHISAQVRQTSPAGKQTATEIDAIAEAGDVLTFFKVREIERFVERITEKIISIVKEFYDQPQLVEIESRFGQPPVWVEWTGSDIGEFTFEAKAGSAAQQNDALKLQQRMQFFQLLMGGGAQVIPNPQPLLESVIKELSELHGIPSSAVEEAFRPPEQQQIPEGAPLPPGGAPPQEVPGGVPDTGVPSINESAPEAPQLPALSAGNVR